MDIKCKTEKEDLDTKNDLFIIPIEYEDKLNKSPEFDTSVHFSQTEAKMYENGSKILCFELPEYFSLTKEVGNSLMQNYCKSKWRKIYAFVYFL